jgi:LysR family transcriptional regulator for bpeEF and oprC
MDKLRALKFFCRAVEAKSFTAAAHGLDVPASVLSKTISALETDLRFTLFNRSTRRVSLTEAGARYYDRCREILLDMDEAEAAAREGSIRPAGILRIGFHPAMRLALFRRLGEFLSANPDVGLELVHTNSFSALLEEGLDVVLRIGDMADSSFVMHRIGQTALVTCASPAYLDAHGRPTHPRDLGTHRAIIPGRRDEDSFTQWVFARDQERQEVRVPVGVVIREGIGLLDVAARGLGIIHVYDIATCNFVEQGSLEGILTDWTSEVQSVYAVIPSRRHMPAKVRAFLDFAHRLVLA